VGAQVEHDEARRGVAGVRQRERHARPARLAREQRDAGSGLPATRAARDSGRHTAINAPAKGSAAVSARPRC
jgi:hypothetical protein